MVGEEGGDRTGRRNRPAGGVLIVDLMNDAGGEDEHGERTSAGGWRIGGRVYRNSAAAFWRKLMDELTDRFSGFNRAVTVTRSGGRIHPGLLTPEARLAAALESDRNPQQTAAEIRDLVARLELTGPGVVELTAFCGKERLGTAPDLVEALDSEIFLYLTAWLLEWGEAPSAEWDGTGVESDFVARDPDNGRRYDCSFTWHNSHLSEGLHERTLVLSFRRSESGEI
jgi:hypothetical protein